MMRQRMLQDRLAWASNVAARYAGDWADAYRPNGPFRPLAPANRFMRLPAFFTGKGGRLEQPLGFGEVVAHGLFDYAYTRPGDCIVLPTATWFILTQDPLQPALCARANRTLGIARPQAPSATGVNPYGGSVPASETPVASGWPCSITGATGGGQSAAGLPTDNGVPYWTVLLPLIPGVSILPGDLLTDDLGRAAVVVAAEASQLGWRVSAKEAVT